MPEEPDLSAEEEEELEQVATSLMAEYDADSIQFHWRDGEFSIEIIFEKPEDVKE